MLTLLLWLFLFVVAPLPTIGAAIAIFAFEASVLTALIVAAVLYVMFQAK